ncbi:MAG: hypothetical protein KBF47_14240 [Gemmatimonadales bacterium]|nr:hypothetical protein [Gemmatimonadales bacterium]
MPRRLVWPTAALLLGALLHATPATAQTMRPRFGARPSSIQVTVPQGAALNLPGTDPNVGPFKIQVFGDPDNKADSLAPATVVSGFQKAARFARDSTGLLANQLDLYGRARPLLEAAAKAGDSRAQMTIIAAVALDQKARAALLEKVPDAAAKAQIEAEAAAIQRSLAGIAGRPVVALYADGTVRDAVGGSGGKDNTTGTGSVGLAVSFPSGWQLNTSVAVASTVDSVKDGFGASVLLPGSGKGKLSTFIFEVFAPPMPKLWHVGVHGYLSGGNSTWVTDTAHARNAAVMGVGLGVYRDFLCTCRLLDTDVAITMTAGVALRTLQGNVAQSPTVLQAALHGSKDRSFAGAEFGLALTIGSVRAGVQYYQMGKADDDISVASLTGGQLVVGISVAGAIVSGPLSPK